MDKELNVVRLLQENNSSVQMFAHCLLTHKDAICLQPYFDTINRMDENDYTSFVKKLSRQKFTSVLNVLEWMFEQDNIFS